MLQLIVDWLTYTVFKLNPQAKWPQVLNFFIYDSVKIILLLFVLISIIGFLRSYLPAGKVKQWLAGKPVILELVITMDNFFEKPKQ